MKKKLKKITLPFLTGSAIVSAIGIAIYAILEYPIIINILFLFAVASFICGIIWSIGYIVLDVCPNCGSSRTINGVKVQENASKKKKICEECNYTQTRRKPQLRY